MQWRYTQRIWLGTAHTMLQCYSLCRGTRLERTLSREATRGTEKQRELWPHYREGVI